MYLTIKKAPSKEEIAKFNMKVVEEDATVDYKVVLDTLDQETKKMFCESFNLPQERVEGVTKVTLSHHNEI